MLGRCSSPHVVELSPDHLLGPISAETTSTTVTATASHLLTARQLVPVVLTPAEVGRLLHVGQLLAVLTCPVSLRPGGWRLSIYTSTKLAQWTLKDSHEGSSFFDGWNWYSGIDPTNGFVDVRPPITQPYMMLSL